MKLGLCLPQLGRGVTSKAVQGFAARADALGYDGLWAQEHLYYPLDNPEGYAGIPGRAWPEPYRELVSPMELLSFVAGMTKQIRVGSSILVTGYHRPVQLAKQAASLDLLSGGRFLLGVGLGWSRSEHALMNAPFEKRGPRATEMLRVLRACWGENPVSFEGEFNSVPPSETSPKPVQTSLDGRPGVPIVAGFWAESAFPRIAELCDYWQPVARDLDKVLSDSAKINAIAKERFGRGPVPLMLRVFASPKLKGVREITASSMQPDWAGGVDDMMPLLRQAKATGAAELIIDTSFFSDNPGEEGWLMQPDFFLPLLEEAHK